MHPPLSYPSTFVEPFITPFRSLPRRMDFLKATIMTRLISITVSFILLGPIVTGAFHPSSMNRRHHASRMRILLSLNSNTKANVNNNTVVRFFREMISFKEEERQQQQQPSITNKMVNPVEQFVQAFNIRELDTCMALFSDDCYYDDATFPKPFIGKESIERQLRLQAQATLSTIVIDEMAVDTSNKIAILYHFEGQANTESRRHIAFYTIKDNVINSVFNTVEAASKKDSADLVLLATASKLLFSNRNDVPPTAAVSSDGSTPPEKYFNAWNRRDMDGAIQFFTEDLTYEDTVFAKPFVGKDALKKHLNICADAFPDSFAFVVDDIANDRNNQKIGVRWHVESNGNSLPFTRGCSFYQITKNGLIQDGIDFVEPAVFKLGGLSLFGQSMKQNIMKEPIRLIPIFVWVAYLYIVFFSMDILPGANALQLEQRTWEEVRDLSLNFFFVSPLLNLPFSPVVHPILEGVFNLLLAWAALFAGFLSDERTRKPNLLPLVPIVVGMQFLTSAFLLPYLATRSTETDDSVVILQDLDLPIVESKILGPFLGVVGVCSLAWGSLARATDFGGWNDRVSSFWDLMSIDRVGSSFLVDLVIFALFQGWLVDDDLKRRGIPQEELGVLRGIAKFVPFFGMALYMTLRPKYPSMDD